MQPIWAAGIFFEPNGFCLDSRCSTGFLVKVLRMVMCSAIESLNVIYATTVRKKYNRSNLLTYLLSLGGPVGGRSFEMGHFLIYIMLAMSR